jgi:ubiquinone/menaquinone biosynthesis C-methylase UbiE
VKTRSSAPTASHPLFARFYVHIAGPGLERAGAAAHRRQLLAELTGDVLEVGAGNGHNFGHYPTRVTRLVAVEPEPRLRQLAQQAATKASVPVDVVDGIAEDLPAADGSFDAVVACMTLCSVADQAKALAECHRVLRPGGQLRFFEHVQAESARMRAAQTVLDAVWPLLCGGCHTGRDTGAAIRAAGFAITELGRFTFPPIRFPSPAGPHILGAATRKSPPPAAQ